MSLDALRSVGSPIFNSLSRLAELGPREPAATQPQKPAATGMSMVDSFEDAAPAMRSAATGKAAATGATGAEADAAPGQDPAGLDAVAKNPIEQLMSLFTDFIKNLFSSFFGGQGAEGQSPAGGVGGVGAGGARPQMAQQAATAMEGLATNGFDGLPDTGGDLGAAAGAEPVDTAAPGLDGLDGSLPAQTAPLRPAQDAATAPTGDTTGVSTDQLRRIMPNLSAERAEAALPLLNSAMNEAGITTPERRSAFLAQLAHESGELRHMEELASGADYEGRADLGNTQPGDGRRFKGRGPIQLTGRANYRAAGEALGIDLERNPERAADPDVGYRVAAWYWQSRGLNGLADQGNFREITRRINGGFNGMADRQRFFDRAQQAL